jgi:DNA-binding NtrC family response regulator
MAGETILVVDDSHRVCDQFAEVLEPEGYAVEKAAGGEEALRRIANRFFDVVLTDLRMPGPDGMDILKHLRENSPETMVIMITGFGSIKAAVEATKLGAFDFLTKPVKFEEIIHVVRRALEHRSLKRENTALKQELSRQYEFKNIVGSSDPIKRLFRMIEKIAETDSTVLILGESGTGKELVARALHYNSHRKDKPLVPVNCGAIPSELLESELFGHEKGAFTSAIRTRVGRFELASGGTIFLDEIGDMSPNLQVKILRVLQEHAFERIGGTRTIKVDIRVIAATNKDLERAVREGRFREDLYYRLNVIPLVVPPLRERREDLPLLVAHFLSQFSGQRGRHRQIKSLGPDVMERFMAYSWPGNVRELENVIERIFILSEGDEICLDDLPRRLQDAVPGGAVKRGAAQAAPAPAAQTRSGRSTSPAPVAPAPAAPALASRQVGDAASEAAFKTDEAVHPGAAALTELASALELRLPDDGVSFNTAVSEFEKMLIVEALNRTGWIKNKAAQLLGLNRTTLVEKIKKKKIRRSQTPASSSF